MSATPASRSNLLLVGLSTCVIMLLVVWPVADISLGGDHYAHLARSFLQGSLNVDDLSPRYRDYVTWEGHKYLPFGPLPAVLLVPFAWLFGLGVPLVFFGYALTVANAFIFRRVLARIGIADERRPWLVLFYFGGTIYLSVTLGGISTFFAHIVVTTFLLLAILEILSKSRPLVIGLLVGLAAASRLTAAFSLPFFLLMLLTGVQSAHATQSREGLEPGSPARTYSGFISNASLVLVGLAVPLLLVAGYNYARFGNPAETGFGLALLYDPALDAARSVGLFSIAHIPKNVYMMLFQGPRPVGGEGAAVLVFPYVAPSQWGMGLFFTSPALVYVFRAPMKDRLVKACWMAVAFTLVPILTYYGIGVVQFGYRYALDFMPFLMLLAARGFPPTMTRHSRLFVASSVAINIWGAITLSLWI